MDTFRRVQTGFDERNFMAVSIGNWKRREPGETSLAWLLVMPSLVLIMGIKLYPLAYSVILSFQKMSVLSPNAKFVGFDNYARLLSNPSFISAFGHTLYFTVVSLVIQVILGIIVALALNQEFAGRNLVRAIVLLPWAVPTVVNALLWQWIYHPQYGVLSGILFKLGIIDGPVQWLGDARLAMNMVIIADTWKTLPLYIIMFLAALQTVPAELHQAAEIDGANARQRFFNVTLPFLMPTMVVVLVLRTMEAFRVFDVIYLMTGGGPGGSTTVVGYYAYLEAFRNLNFSSGAAASNTIVVTVAAISFLYMRLLRSRAFD
jgi:ABC-type sugar transport system permease subunit